MLTSWTPAGSAARRTALTLSGLRAAPYAKRSVRVGDVGVRFRAPTSSELAAVALAWERPGTACTLDLHADAAGAPAALLRAQRHASDQRLADHAAHDGAGGG